jgi:hypothetical protein
MEEYIGQGPYSRARGFMTIQPWSETRRASGFPVLVLGIHSDHECLAWMAIARVAIDLDFAATERGHRMVVMVRVQELMNLTSALD